MKNISLNIEKALGAVSKEQVFAQEAKVMACMATLHNGDGAGNDFLGWLRLPSSITDEELTDIENTAKTLREKCEVVVAVGIGGSYLGTRAVVEALNNSFDALQSKRENPVLLYAGNNIGVANIFRTRNSVLSIFPNPERRPNRPWLSAC